MDVLLIEDNPAEARLIQEMIRVVAGNACHLEWVNRLSDGLAHLAEHGIDVILLDLSLPDSRGFQTFAEAYAQAPEVPMIVLSGLDNEELAMRAVREGAQDYLVKGEVDGNLLVRAMRYAVQRKHAEEEIARRNKELATLNKIAATINRSLNLNQILKDALDAVLHLDLLQNGARCAIFLLDNDDMLLRLAVQQGMPDDFPCFSDPIACGECLCGQAASSGEVVIASHPTDARHTRVTAEGLAHQDICIPLKARGEVLGVLNVWLTPDTPINEASVQLLRAISDQIGMAVENAWLYEEAQRRARELVALNKTGQAITSTLELDAVLELVMREAQAMLSVEAASVLLHEPGVDKLIFAATVGPAAAELVGNHIPAGSGVAGWVFREGRPALVRKAPKDNRFYNAIDHMTGLNTHSILAVPLTYKERTIGVIEALNKQDGHFNEHDLELLSALSASAASAIENARLFEAEREQRKLVEQSQSQLVQSEKLAATGRLAASMAHEINNPLQAIHNSLQLMISFPMEPDEQAEYLEMADEEVERLISMVGRILDFARRPQREMRPTDVNDVIKKVLALSAKFLQHRHVALQQNLMPGLPYIVAIPGELGQVFLNLLLNAVDAMPDGGTLRVSTQLSEDGWLVATFSDTGHGIPPDHVDRIFEPFFSTKEGGTGLGLAVSYNVVTRHQGTITVESALGGGSTFTVRLPVQANP
ncbi:MAG: GAF domain-containing protein [Anaerolineae bacterium]|nr:GAF domain-containing protein [Anaerolineae bacterium]